MPRKRAIKPDFNADENIAALSPWARLLYIGLWGQMDRHGLMEDSPALMRSKVFPADDHTLAQIEGWRDELLKGGPSGPPRLIRFRWKTKRLLFCPTFARHQKVYPDEPAVFDVPREILDELRKKWEKGEVNQDDSLPQPGSVSASDTGLRPTQEQARRSPFPSASASPSASPSASAPADRPADPGFSRCAEAWLKTLEHFKQKRRLIPGEDLAIQRAILRYGADLVELALIGLRFEKKTEGPDGFDPAQHVYLDRILRADRFARFVGLGTAELERQRRRAQPSGGVVPPGGPPIENRFAAGNHPERELTLEEIQAEIRKRFPAMKAPKREQVPETPEEIGAAIEESLARAQKESA